MPIFRTAPRLSPMHVAALFALLGCAALRAEDTPAPEKCDCKPLQVTVTRAAARAVANRADSGVTIFNFTFTGSPITINVGDTVTWTNTDAAPHTVTSDTGVFDSGTLTSGGGPFSFTFNSAGTFPYHCAIHPFMTGSVVVQAPQQQAPIITSATTAQSLVGASFSYTLTATGNPAPTFAFANVPSGLVVNGATLSGTTNTPGSFSIGLAASNGVAPDAAKTLTLTVGTAPAITSATTASSVIGAPFTYTLTATGSPAPTLTFTNVPTGLTASNGVLSGSLATGGQFSVGIQATNIFGTDSRTLVITVGTAPAITSPLYVTTVVNAGFSYTLTGTGSPAPTLSFPTPPPGLFINGATISGTFSTIGQIMIPVRATNAIGTVDKILVVEVGTTPTITSPLAVTTTVGASFMYTLTASGAPAPVLSFTSIPIGFQTNGPVLTGTFGQTGTVSVVLHAINAIGMTDQTLVITVNPSSDAAVITSPLTQQSLVGASYTYTLKATGSPAPTLSFTNVPADLTVSGATISGTTNTSGVYNIGLHAANAAGADDKTLVLTVGTPAVISSATIAKSLLGTSFSYTLTATGSPAPVLTFTNVPANFTVTGNTLTGTFATEGYYSVGIHAANTFATDDKTLVITAGTAPVITSPLAAGTVIGTNFTYTLTATGFPLPILNFTDVPLDLTVNGDMLEGNFKAQKEVTVGLNATNIFSTATQTLTVTSGRVPVITSPIKRTVLVGAAFNYTLTAVGPPAPAVADLTFTDVPSDLTVDNNTLAGSFAAPGIFMIGLHATNPIGTDDKILELTVATVPVITSVLSVDAVVGVAFSYTLTATGSPAPDFTFTPIPADLSASGADLSGTFTTDGVFTIGLKATNAGGTDTATLTITAREVPMINSDLAATTVVGADFEYIITAAGTAPFTKITATNLPAALTLSGARISGRANTANVYNIPLKVENPAGSDSKTLKLTVLANTEGIGGNWTGKLKGKEFDQTGDRPQSFADSKNLTVSFTQVGRDLYAKVSFDGATPYQLKGRIGLNNFWISGKDTAGTNTVTLSGQVDKKLKSIKGQGLVFTSAGSEEFTLTLTKSR